MKVILIKDVARLGRKSEVKDVPSGHALNFLIPRKLAVIATPEQLKKISEETKQHDAQKEHAHTLFKDACTLLASKTITYPTEANAQGHLFKGVNTDDIVHRIAETEGVILDARTLHLEHPIKDVGVHTIPLQFDGITGTCTLEIVKK